MNNLLNKEQHKELGYVFMWYADWKTDLHTNTSGMTMDEMVEHEEIMQWHAYMAVKDCDELGLDAELLFSPTLIGHAWEYKNEVLPRQMEMTRKELEAEGII